MEQIECLKVGVSKLQEKPLQGSCSIGGILPKSEGILSCKCCLPRNENLIQN